MTLSHLTVHLQTASWHGSAKRIIISDCKFKAEQLMIVFTRANNYKIKSRINKLTQKPIWYWGEFPIKDPISDQRCAHLCYQQKLCAIDTFNEKLFGKNLKNGSAHILYCKHRLRIFFSYGLIENWYLIGNSPQYHIGYNDS